MFVLFKVFGRGRRVESALRVATAQLSAIELKVARLLDLYEKLFGSVEDAEVLDESGAFEQAKVLYKHCVDAKVPQSEIEQMFESANMKMFFDRIENELDNDTEARAAGND